MAGLILISVTFCLVAVNVCGTSPSIRFPGGFAIDLGVLTTTLSIGGAQVSIPWLYVVFCLPAHGGPSPTPSTSPTVLDGLAGGCTMVVMLVMAMVAFRYNEVDLPSLPGAIAGPGLPLAQLLPRIHLHGRHRLARLGAAFAALAILTKTEVTSLIMGGVFVCEALSVMIQVTSFKLTGKRVFLMTPIHHHFEQMGWAETKVVIRF